jgi:hypothetical protein
MLPAFKYAVPITEDFLRMHTNDAGLIGHWPLAADTCDHSPSQHDTQAVDVELGLTSPQGQNSAARFNGRTSVLRVADHPAFSGKGEFSCTVWVHTKATTDVVGDLISKFDSRKRNGFHLSILSNTGVTSATQTNYRHLQFGIDDARLDEEWTDCGRPGNARHIPAVASVEGHLYAATVEIGEGEVGGLWRYEGGQEWRNLGNPVGCNGAQSIAYFNGAIYCGFGRYATRGSDLGATELNPIPGGQVYRLESDGSWIFCGHPGIEDAVPDEVLTTSNDSGKADEATALTVFNGQLYCTSHHRRGVFRYVGGERWEPAGLGNERVMTFGLYRNQLYALINGGPVYRLESDGSWTYCGCPSGSTQTYASVICEGRFYVGTWPECEVFRYEGGDEWTKIKRVGWEREVMAMVMYNGKMYLGTLPMANVWRMDGGTFSHVSTLDHSNAALRRVWSMAVHNDKLFAGTTPSGHIKSISAGALASWDFQFPAGWHHVAAVKKQNELLLYVDGICRARRSIPASQIYSFDNKEELKIGFGPFEYFRGLMSDMRIYNRALEQHEIEQLSTSNS